MEKQDNMKIQQRLLKCVTRTNWVLFFLLSACGFLFFSKGFALGIFFGGLIVTINFHLLARTLKKIMTPQVLNPQRAAMVKYYIRFIVSGLVIFVLISKHIVEPLGLFVGLSLVVGSILFATMCELKTYISKEAT
jgi:hypothetical protein